MIVYNNEWLRNIYIREQADEALHENSISQEAHAAIYLAKPVGFYQPNIYAQIGLALATLVIVSFTFGFFALLLVSSNSSTTENVLPFLLMAMGLSCYFLAVIRFIKNENHYNAGTDNMLVWMSGVLLYSGILTMHGMHFAHTMLSMVALCISLFLALRFADTLMTLAAFGSLLALVFYGFNRAGSWGMAALPFIMILVTGITYYLVSKYAPKFPLYRHCTYYLRLASLVALYAAGNYYIVSSLGGQFNPDGTPAPLPMGWFFWLWTFAIPVAYVILGIRGKQVMLIRTGILLLVAGIFTFRHFHSVLPAEIALTIGGVILIITSYMLINYLKTPHGRFTFAPGYHGHEKTAIELMIDKQISDKHSAHSDAPSEGNGW